MDLPVVGRNMGEKHLDACLRVVSDGHRRRVIHWLREESNGTTTIDDLVEHLHESDPAPHLDQNQLAIQLAHKHLPKLVDHGVVEVDSGTDTVRYQPDERVETILDSLPERVPQPNS